MCHLQFSSHLDKIISAFYLSSHSGLSSGKHSLVTLINELISVLMSHIFPPPPPLAVRRFVHINIILLGVRAEKSGFACVAQFQSKSIKEWRWKLIKSGCCRDCFHWQAEQKAFSVYARSLIICFLLKEQICAPNCVMLVCFGGGRSIDQIYIFERYQAKRANTITWICVMLSLIGKKSIWNL